jgi:hypothetical protein
MTMDERHETEQQPQEQLSTADLAGRTREPDAMDDRIVDSQPAGMPSNAATATADTAPLFGDSDAEDFRSRWEEIQASFVDEPRQAVEQADGLVAEVIQRLATVFADERTSLEDQWGSGDDISTEDLRIALRRYRSFFDRLLSV